MFWRLALGLLALLALSTASVFADGFGSRTPGQHVIDRANVLQPEQLRSLEARAANLETLGAPTVIYLRVESASQAQAQQEARDLMDAWDVESSRGAHDGFVMLLDLTPGNTTHGQVAMFAGAQHAQVQLDADELNRIARDVMRPNLASGDLAAGIRAGLDAAADDVRLEPSSQRPSAAPLASSATAPSAAAALASAGGSASSPTPSPSNFVTNLPFFVSLPVVGIILLLVLFTLPFMLIAFVMSMIKRAMRGGRRHTWGSSAWTDNNSWSGGGGGDSGGASSGGDSGGTSF